MAEGFTPAEDFTQDGYEKNEAENIEMEDRDSWEQTSQAPDEFAKPPEQETSLDEKLPVAPETIEYLERDRKNYKLLQEYAKKGLYS